ncbi:MAG: hypothetical protein IPH44_38895 [Myxococcales bacterium]|nr:hypothetical protein [Myxococcales bacterium]
MQIEARRRVADRLDHRVEAVGGAAEVGVEHLGHVVEQPRLRRVLAGLALRQLGQPHLQHPQQRLRPGRGRSGCGAGRRTSTSDCTAASIALSSSSLAWSASPRAAATADSSYSTSLWPTAVSSSPGGCRRTTRSSER